MTSPCSIRPKCVMSQTVALVLVAIVTCLLVSVHLAKTLRSACVAQLEICLEQLIRSKPLKAPAEPSDVVELKVRMGRLEHMIARVLIAVDKPISSTSDVATQTHSQEGYRHRQKPQDLSRDKSQFAPSSRARSWESNFTKARDTPPRKQPRARSYEYAGGSFSLDGKTWNPQIFPNSTDFGKSRPKRSSDSNLSTQPVQMRPDHQSPATQVSTRIETDTPRKLTVDDALRMLNRDVSSGTMRQ